MDETFELIPEKKNLNKSPEKLVQEYPENIQEIILAILPKLFTKFLKKSMDELL